MKKLVFVVLETNVVMKMMFLVVVEVTVVVMMNIVLVVVVILNIVMTGGDECGDCSGSRGECRDDYDGNE